MAEKKKLNILFAADSFPPNCGGQGYSNYYLAKALIEKGHKVFVVRFYTKDSHEKYDGIDVYNVKPFSPCYIDQELLVRKLRKKIKWAIKEHDIDIIHAQHVVSVRAVDNLRFPRVATVRDHWPICYKGSMFHEWNAEYCSCTGYGACAKCIYKENKGLVKIFSPLVALYMKMRTKKALDYLKTYPKVICTSNYVKKMLMPYIGEKRLVVVHNLIDYAKFAKVKEHKFEKKTVVFVGKFNVNKGPQLLMEAAKEFPELKFIFIGEGVLKQSLLESAKKNNVDAVFPGYVENDKMLSMVKGSFAYVSTSIIHDTLSRSVLEAISVGAAVIATDVGGTSDIIQDGYNGLLVKPDANDIAEKLRMLLNDEKLRQKIRNNAVKTAKEKFDKGKLVGEFERVYRGVI